MNNDQKILEEMVGEIIEEIAKHGKVGRLSDILKDAEDKGFIKVVERNHVVMIRSLKDRQQYTAHRGEVAVEPVLRFLKRLGYE